MKPFWAMPALGLAGLLATAVAAPANADGPRAQPGPYSYDYGPIYYPGPGAVAVGVPPVYRVPPPPDRPPMQALRLGAWPSKTAGPSCFTQPHWVWMETVGYRRRNIVVCY